MQTRTAEYARPNHFLLHISDTHLLADGRLYNKVDSQDNLRRLFNTLERSGIAPEAIVFTGDLADKGEPEAYQRLKDIVQPVAASLGAELVWVMGNHDSREHFRQQLIGGPATSAPYDAVRYVGGLRIISLDTTVPGHHYGDLDDEQLAWLADELAIPAPEGTILAMHHPPVPCIQDLAVTVELRRQKRLADVLRGSDVRSILAGHLHYSTSATFAGIPVSVASATCYTQDLAVTAHQQRAWDGAQSFNMVHVYDETIVHSVEQIAAFEALTFTTSDESARILAADGIVIPGSHPAPALVHASV